MNAVPPVAATRAAADAAPADAPASDAHTRAGIAPDGLPPRLGDAARLAWQDLRGALHQRLRLATLELKLVGLTLAQAVLLGLVAGLLLVTAWLALVAGLTWGAIQAGAHWAVAVAGAVVLNLVVAGVLVTVMLRLLARLDLPGTLHALQPHRATPTPPAPPPAR
ncbi:phage holin family protein [Aquabacterium sp. J223]|uniref:phage holin family protein n=1 Tax=Aquabacterium sp. J223 TaxID=2898431 RepID=UPI0021ADD9EC|nr:phage holin family protein [Aquabacterium sp. J223]UUX94267.1 phage holin family protein [Aquabacterium sp. J223]